MVPDSLNELASRMEHLQAKSGGRAPLLAHLCDVCAQAASFLAAFRPVWPLPDVNPNRVLAYATLMHDFGKVHPGFQAALQPGGPRFRNRHEVLSVAFLGWLNIPDAERPWIAAAIITHHKNWIDLSVRFAGEATSEETDLAKLCKGIPDRDARLLHEVLRASQTIFASAAWPGFEPYPLHEYVALDYSACVLRGMGEVGSLAQRMMPPPPLRPGARLPRDWRPVEAGIYARGWMLSADHLASFRPYAIESALETLKDVDRLYPTYEWNSHQRAVAIHDGSGLLIAPTGSGKTEAALRWAARQAELGTHGRVCVLLPYQTSLNAMQKRLIERLHPEVSSRPDAGWSGFVSLLHGRAARHLYEAFLELEYAPAEAESKARDQNELARLLAAPVAVSTVFSLIRLLFATRGPERLMVSFTGARIVLDEVHAYQPQVTALTLASLRFLTERLASKVLFMSATVPPHLETALRQTIGVSVIRPESTQESRPRHRLSLLPADCISPRGVRMITEASRNGSVLVVVNQVRRAMELWKLLRRDLDCQLLHSRYHFADRARIESRIEPKSGVVLVGTQAVEVSLDLDFDVCFTELAPIESLAQRFGRCNRKGLREPAPVYVFSSFPAGQRSYLPYGEAHLRIVSDVLKEFCDAGQRNLGNRDVESLLARSYPEGLKLALQAEITEKVGALEKLFLESWKPFGLDSSPERQELESHWAELFDGVEVLPEACVADAKAQASRLGMMRFLVPISKEQSQRFREAIRWDPELMCQIIARPYGEGGLDLHTPGLIPAPQS